MAFFQRWLLRGVLWVVAHPKLTLGGAAAVLVAAVVSAVLRLDISTDQNKLFSPNVPFFRDYLDYDKKFPESQAIYVVVEPKEGLAPPVSRWAEAADVIAARLKAMPREVKQVDSRFDVNDPGAPAILFQDPSKLPETFQQARDQLAGLARIWGDEPGGLEGLLSRAASARTRLERFLVALQFHKSDEQTAQFVGAIAKSWARAAQRPNEPMRVGSTVPDLASIAAGDPSELGYYYEPDRTDPSRHLLLIRVYEQEDTTSLNAAYATVDAIRRAVREEAKPFAEFDIGLTGRPVLDADEMKITDRDSHKAEIVALTVVFIGLVLLLRSMWLAIVAELSLAIAIGWTFGWATLTIGELNLLSTVFLIALIGIGMDYLIQILAAYRREARRYVRPAAVWARVFRYVGPPVVTACLGAAGAFFVSVFTDFRGAAELGIIAGGGLLLCLLAGYTVLPAILVLFPAKLKSYPAHARYGAAPPRSRWRLLLPCMWILLLVVGVPWAWRAEFNPNLLDLQAPDLPSVKLVKKIQTWSAVVLSDNLQLLRDVRKRVTGATSVAGTDSILSAFDNEQWLREHASELPKISWSPPPSIRPADLPGIAGKARALADRLAQASGAEARAAAAELRQFADAITDKGADTTSIASALSSWQVTFAAELRQLFAQLVPPPLEVRKIPPEMRQHWASDIGQPTGHYVFALYIEPKQDLWKRDELETFVKQVEARVQSVPKAPAVTGIAPDIYHTTSAIERAFYQATAYALGLIFLLVLIDLRDLRQTLIAVSVLALGLPMLVAVMGLLGVSWNFANFFGLPILIGAGHEYGVFMMHRYREALHNPRRVWRRWDAADRALLLCAFVTSSSFGFFWALGHHKGLRSLGLVMAVGTACIYLATILVVRPLLTWRLEHQRAGLASRGTPPGGAPESENGAAIYSNSSSSLTSRSK